MQGPTFKRRLSENGREQITVGIQIKSAASGLLPAAVEASIDYLTSRKQLFEEAVALGVAVIAKANVLPESFDFSEVSNTLCIIICKKCSAIW